MMRVQMRIVKDPIKLTEQIKKQLRNKVIRIAMNAAAATVKSSMESAVPNRTGGLRKSLRIRIKNYRNKECWVAVVGPSMKYKQSLTRKTKTKAGTSYRPARIAHILERGSKKMPGRGFMRATYGATRTNFLQILTAKISEQVNQILKQGG